jgi:hypothetical protein
VRAAKERTRGVRIVESEKIQAMGGA